MNRAISTDPAGLDAASRQWLERVAATIYVTDASWWLGTLHFLSDSVVDISGRDADVYLDQPALWMTAIPEPERRQVLESLEAALASGATRLHLIYSITLTDGSRRTLDDTLSLQRDADGAVVSLTGLLVPRAAPLAVMPPEAAQIVVKDSADLLLQLDPSLECRFAGGDIATLLGGGSDAVCGQSLMALMAPEDAPRVQRALVDARDADEPALLELRLRRNDGQYRWFEAHFSSSDSSLAGGERLATAVASGDGGNGWVVVARDITERRRQSLTWDAYSATDELTSALNHDAFSGLLRQALAMMGSSDRLSMIVFDVDRLGEINRQWGRVGGDLVLSCVGELCRATLRERFSFGRLNGGAFAILLSGKSLTETATVAERLRTRFAATRVEFHGHWLAFSVSLGIAEGRRGESAETLLARAEAGLNQAKQQGRDRVQQAP